MYRTLFEGIEKNIELYAKEAALQYKDRNTGGWQIHSWSNFGQLLEKTAKSLLEIGIREKENVGIFSQNMPEWTITDLAIIKTKGVSVPIYATNTVDQANYVIKEAEIRFLFVGSQEQYDKALDLYARSDSSLEKIIVFDETVNIKNDSSIHLASFLELGANQSSRELELRSASIQENDLATIIYTSGTTGEPKGVMLNQENFNEAIRIHDLRLTVTHQDHSLCFLPLSHIFERAWTIYALHQGLKITFLEDPKKIIETLGEVKPTVLCSVPRLYQKAYHTILSKVNKGSNFKKKLFHTAISTGKQRTEFIRSGKTVPTLIRLKHRLFDRIIFKKIRSVFGGKLKIMPCGGAPLSGEITEFFHSIGLPVLIGYGLTETTASVTVFPDKNYKFGTVGVNLPHLEVRIGKDDEILVKGKTVMKGYYKKPHETVKVFENGWLKTGDAGTIDEEGHLKITDRIKDLMKTSGGKYIAPQPIESLLTNDDFIEQAILIGDEKPYVTALLVPNFEALKEYARSLNLDHHSIEELLKTSKVYEFYEQKLEQIQTSLASFEKVKKFRLLPEDFNMNLGELTPTLKIRRQTIHMHFKPLIEEMYTFA